MIESYIYARAYLNLFIANFFLFQTNQYTEKQITFKFIQNILFNTIIDSRHMRFTLTHTGHNCCLICYNNKFMSQACNV